jgi:hypothetical protein
MEQIIQYMNMDYSREDLVIFIWFSIATISFTSIE